MKWNVKRRSERVESLQRGIVAAVVAVLCLLIVGCSGTVTPKPIRDAMPSWDGTNQNSGLQGWTVDGRIVVSSHWLERYNALIDVYGSRFTPSIKRDAGVAIAPDGLTLWKKGNQVGVTRGDYFVDPQHWVYMVTMNRWRKEGK